MSVKGQDKKRLKNLAKLEAIWYHYNKESIYQREEITSWYRLFRLQTILLKKTHHKTAFKSLFLSVNFRIKSSNLIASIWFRLFKINQNLKQCGHNLWTIWSNWNTESKYKRERETEILWCERIVAMGFKFWSWFQLFTLETKFNYWAQNSWLSQNYTWNGILMYNYEPGISGIFIWISFWLL